MTTKIYVEGGGDNRDTIVRCKRICRAAKRFARRIGDPLSSRVAAEVKHLIASRSLLKTARRENNPHCWLTQEGAVDPSAAPATYLHARDRWDFSQLPGDRVFLMVQAMEAWFLADRNTLAAYYGEGLNWKALPFDELHIESIPKNQLEPALVNATRATKTKGRYNKTRHAFALLVAIDPIKVERGSLHAAAFNDFLRSL